MTPKLITIIIFLLHHCLALHTSFHLTKQPIRSNPPPTQQLGSLSIIQQQKSNIGYIEEIQPIFITEQELDKYGSIAINFVQKVTGKEYSSVVHAAAYGNERQVGRSKGFREKVQVVLGAGEQVVGFNYVRVYGRAGTQVEVEIVEPEKGVDHVFKVQAQKKEVVAEESFFSKYKWPLIIGGVLIYMTMNADPQKLQGGQAAARQQ